MLILPDRSLWLPGRPNLRARALAGLMAGKSGVCPGPQCGSCTCAITVCVTGCFGGALVGATVNLRQDGTTFTTFGTTGSGGCVTLTVPAAGGYTVTVSATGYTTYSADQSLACGQTLNVTLEVGTGYTCTGCQVCDVAIPTTLTANDGLGDITLTYQGPDWTIGTAVYGSYVWAGCAMRTITGVCYYDSTCVHKVTEAGSVNVPLYLVMYCCGTEPDLQYCITGWIPVCFKAASTSFYVEGYDCTLSLSSSMWDNYGGAGQSSLVCDPFDWTGVVPTGGGSGSYCDALGVCGGDTCGPGSCEPCDLYGCTTTYTVTA